MAYTDRNFRSKKALKEALARGDKITCYAPGLGTVPDTGTVYLEGPHYPEPHRWYAQGRVQDGYLVGIK